MDNTFVRLYWFLFRSLNYKTGKWRILLSLPDNVPEYLCITLERSYKDKIHRYPIFIRADALMQLSDIEVLDKLYTKVDSVPEQGEQDA